MENRELPTKTKRIRPKGAPLKDRKFPNLDRLLHCAAVRVADELELIMKQDLLDVKKVAALTDILLLVRKRAPQLEAQQIAKKQAKQAGNQAEDLLDE